MKEDQNVYNYLERETKEKIQRLENRFNFGLEINKIKLNIFEKREENEKNRFLPKIIDPRIKNPDKMDNSGSHSHRSLGRGNMDNQKKIEVKKIFPLISKISS